MSVVRELHSRATPTAIVNALDNELGHTKRVHGEEHQTSEGTVAIVVYEQYFTRVKNRIALTIIADNLQGETRVRIIASGANMIFNINWGAAGSYASEAEGIINRLRGRG